MVIVSVRTRPSRSPSMPKISPPQAQPTKNTLVAYPAHSPTAGLVGSPPSKSTIADRRARLNNC
jgi:hypothetical protein